jgi:hypothetical protein
MILSNGSFYFSTIARIQRKVIVCVITTQDKATQLCLTEHYITRMNLVFVPWRLNAFKNIFCSSCRQMGRRMSDVLLFQRG